MANFVLNELCLMTNQNLLSMIINSDGGVIRMYAESLGSVSKLTEGLLDKGESSILLMIKQPIGIPLRLITEFEDDIYLEVQSIKISPISSKLWKKLDSMNIEDMYGLWFN